MNRRTLLASGAALAGLGVIGFSALTPKNAQLDFGMAAMAQNAEVDPEKVKEMVLGDENAPITVVEYASFTCPHCASFHKDVYPTLKSEYIDTGKVKFILREVYFDRLGLWGGMLARCDGDAKYFGVVDMLYKRQREWTKGEGADIVQNLYKIGRIAGMQDEAMEACLQNRPFAEELVAIYQKNVEVDEVSSTPSFVINGEKYSNMGANEFRSTLDKMLEG